jgi:hypothetical protein
MEALVLLIVMLVPLLTFFAICALLAEIWDARPAEMIWADFKRWLTYRKFRAMARGRR